MYRRCTVVPDPRPQAHVGLFGWMSSWVGLVICRGYLSSERGHHKVSTLALTVAKSSNHGGWNSYDRAHRAILARLPLPACHPCFCSVFQMLYAGEHPEVSHHGGDSVLFAHWRPPLRQRCNPPLDIHPQPVHSLLSSPCLFSTGHSPPQSTVNKISVTRKGDPTK